MTTAEKPKTLYEKVFDGEIPSYSIYDDPENGFKAILDIYPATKGHTIVMPREPVDRVYELPVWRGIQLSRLSVIVMDHLQEKLQPLRVTEEVHGHQIPHAHRMVIPSYERGDTAFLHDPARMQQPVDHEALATLHARLQFTAEQQADIQSRLKYLGGLVADCT